jgi:hypothetical protein
MTAEFTRSAPRLSRATAAPLKGRAAPPRSSARQWQTASARSGSRQPPHPTAVIASEAKQSSRSSNPLRRPLDCFVATLLAIAAEFTGSRRAFPARTVAPLKGSAAPTGSSAPQMAKLFAGAGGSHQPPHPTAVIASEAKQSRRRSSPLRRPLDCFVAGAPRNDGGGYRRARPSQSDASRPQRSRRAAQIISPPMARPLAARNKETPR